MSHGKPPTLSIAIGVLLLTACHSTPISTPESPSEQNTIAPQENGESVATVTQTPPLATEVPSRVVRFYYPNKDISTLLNQTPGGEDPDLSEVDPRIGVEKHANWLNSNCSGDYAYVERRIPEEDFSVQYAMNLYFTNQLTEEEKQLGFFNEWTDMELVSITEVVDEDGSIAAKINSAHNSGEYQFLSPGADYLEIVYNDKKGGYFNNMLLMGNCEQAFCGPWHAWQEELASFSDEQSPFCFLQTADTQLEATLLQFYPNYKRGIWNSEPVDQSMALTEYIYNITIEDAYGCRESTGTVCEGLPAFYPQQFIGQCWTKVVYGQEHVYCYSDLAAPTKWAGDTSNDPILEEKDLTAVCMAYPDTYVCSWPEVKATLP